jgi:hypothetical protein
MKHCSNERFLIVLDIINNVEPKYEKLRSLIQLPVRECKHGHPLFYAEHVLFYQYGHPFIMQNTSYSTSMVTPVLCTTRFILPVWLLCIMQNTRVHSIALSNEILQANSLRYHHTHNTGLSCARHANGTVPLE